MNTGLCFEHLDPRAWRATAPGERTRTIAAIFSSAHNVRRKWLRLSAPHIILPAALDRAHSTQEQTRAALAESAARCCDMLTETLVQANGRVPAFRRDGWARPWRASPAMLAYMIAHHAHQRGQVCLLAHQLGFICLLKPITESGLGKSYGSRRRRRLSGSASNLSRNASKNCTWPRRLARCSTLRIAT
jgi:uncharacterized damage-inducible protein DinB